MKQTLIGWMFTHPWMTFFIVLAFLATVEKFTANLLRYKTFKTTLARGQDINLKEFKKWIDDNEDSQICVGDGNVQARGDVK